MNQPDRADMFSLMPGEPKIEWLPDTKQNAKCPETVYGTFVLHKEDHALGNLLTVQLQSQTDNVCWASYKIPHPARPILFMEVGTKAERQCNPKSELLRAIDELDCVLNKLEQSATEPGFLPPLPHGERPQHRHNL